MTKVITIFETCLIFHPKNHWRGFQVTPRKLEGAFSVLVALLAGELQGNKELAAAAFNARVIPRVAYTEPDVDSVGLTKDPAKAQSLRHQGQEGPIPLDGLRPRLR